MRLRYVGFNRVSLQGQRAFEIAREFRQRGKVVVMGGPITSLIWTHAPAMLM
jgi:hypothetical protein